MRQILLLHGAIGAQNQFSELRDILKDNYEVHTLDFCGHGANEKSADVFSIGTFANSVLDYLEIEKIEKIDVFGYSMGGYVALYLAKFHPEKVERIFTMATKFLWTPEIATHEIKMLDPEKITEKIPAFALQLEKRHQLHDWKKVLLKTADMMVALGNSNALLAADLNSITHQTLIGIGDRDTMVTLEETIETYRNLPNASLIVFPNTQHPIEKIDPIQLKLAIEIFLR